MYTIVRTPTLDSETRAFKHIMSLLTKDTGYRDTSQNSSVTPIHVVTIHFKLKKRTASPQRTSPLHISVRCVNLTTTYQCKVRELDHYISM